MTLPQWLKFSSQQAELYLRQSPTLLWLAEATVLISLSNILCFGTERKPLIWLHIPSYHVDDGAYWLQKSLASAFVCLAWCKQKVWFHIVLVRCRFYTPFLLPDQCPGKTTNLLGGLYNSLLFPNLFKFRVWNHCNKTTKAIEFTDKLKPLLQWLRCNYSTILSMQILFSKEFVSSLNQWIARTVTSHVCLMAGQAWMQYNTDSNSTDKLETIMDFHSDISPSMCVPYARCEDHKML